MTIDICDDYILCCILAQVMCFRQCKPSNHDYLEVLRHSVNLFSLYIQINAIENSCKHKKVLFRVE